MRFGARLTALAAVFTSVWWSFATAVEAQLAPADIRANGRSAVIFLDTGQGLCAIVVCPNQPNVAERNVVLSDCGSNDPSGGPRLQSARALFTQVVGPNDPLSITLSHPDTDHYDEIAYLVSDHPVQNIILGGTTPVGPNGTVDPSTKYHDFLTWVFFDKMLRPGGGGVNHDFRIVPNLPSGLPPPDPVSLPLCGQGPGNFYALVNNAGTSNNSQSLVTRFVFGNFSALFTGDADKPTNRVLLRYASQAVKSTVVGAEHHGASTNGSNAPPFVIATRPKVVVYSAGLNSNYGHPRCGTASNYSPTNNPGLAASAQHELRCYDVDAFKAKNLDRAQYSTADSGAVIILSNGAQWQLWTCAGNRLEACLPSAQGQ